MELDTQHDRGFYLEKAKEYSLLSRVTSGETTLWSWFERMLEDARKIPLNSLPNSPGLKTPREGISLEEFLMMLSDVARTGEDYLALALQLEFEPLYNAIHTLDANLQACFLPEYFITNRKHFEQAYLTVGQEEREQVDTRLYALLGAGGMKGMDEIQLNDYLSGLLAQGPEVEGDA